MKSLKVCFIVLLIAFFASCQSENSCSQKGWTVLFDGKDVSQWRVISGDSFPDNGWLVKDGLLIIDPESGRPGDLITKKQYSNFELVLDFMINEHANGGIKYFVVEALSKGGKGGLGFEYQIIDDATNPDARAGKGGNHTCASLYDLIAAPVDKPINPIGQWNTVRIVAKGKHVEHWLNGKKILEFKRDDPEFRKLVAQSKYKNIPDFGLAKEGHILLQDHGDKVYFRSIKIREL